MRIARAISAAVVALTVTAMALAIQPPTFPKPSPASTSPPKTLTPPPTRDLSAAPTARVVRAMSGEMIEVVRDHNVEFIRLLGVSAPETASATRDGAFHGTESLAGLDNLLKGESVYLLFEKGRETDENGLALAHVYRAPDGLWVNLELVRQGYARANTQQLCSDSPLLAAYQGAAEHAGRGVWNRTKATDWAKQQEEKKRAQLPAVAPPQPPPRAPAVTQPPREEPQAVTVYVTRSGAKYHQAGCRYLRSSIPMDLDEAKRRYTPCSVCRPPS